MGAGASIPDQIDESTAKSLAGDKFNQAKFDELKSDDGCITKEQFTSAAGAGEEVVKKDSNESEQMGEADQDAATKIQAVQRGKKSRAEMESKQDSATKVQAIERGRQARRKGRTLIGIESSGADNDTRIGELFKKFDINGNGKIDLDEVRVYFGNEEEAQQIMKELDTIKVDNEVSTEEWSKYFKTIDGDALNAALTLLETIVITADLSEEDAAKKIQAIQRGKSSRKEQNDKAEAAAKIQAIQRGKAVRADDTKEVKKVEESEGAGAAEGEAASEGTKAAE